MAKESKELAKKDEGLPPLATLPNPAELKEMLEENLGGLEPSFETIHMPTGGMTAWSIPTEGDDPEISKELVGIVLHHYSVRAYWEKRFGQDGSGGPPTCASLDCRNGSLPRNQAGEFGDCDSCKWAQFGTATKQDGTPGRGQACSLKHRVFFLMPERSFFPFLIPLSTTSTTKKYEGSISTYGIKLAGRGKKLAHVRTKIKLIEDRNADGIKYAKAQFFFVSDLSNDEKSQIDGIRQTLDSAMRNKPVDVDEAEIVTSHLNSDAESDTGDEWMK
jgi:hypothetical protein